ncbi:hypothetical protein N8203_01745 [Crocinitomicaceae bacterium]|nr:hypothetical protein [Crocinitomicaceae bacterium]
MNENLTFEKLPEAVSFLTQEVTELKELLSKKKDEKPSTPQEKLLTIKKKSEQK